MTAFNIYIIGVGGQGIGLLSEVIIRAADAAGISVRGVDTHGLAQRGGTVESFVRLGESNSPLVNPHEADLVLALERHEALRGAIDYAKRGGTLAYDNVVWQPLDVRLRQSNEIRRDDISHYCREKAIREICVGPHALSDVRMQNMLLLAHVIRENVIPRLDVSHVFRALDELLPPKTLDANKALFS